MTALSRRAFLGATALGILGAGALAGCTPSVPGGPAPGNAGAALPKRFPFAGITPDFVSTHDMGLSAFRHYPVDPVSAYKGTPGDGKPITGLTQLNGPLPPGVDANPYWQELNRRVGSPMKIQQVAAGADFNTRLATITAGDDLPDMMQINSTVPALSAFMTAKMTDLTPYLSGDNIKKYPGLANIPTPFWRGCVFDGRLRALPISRGVYSASVMLNRRDLLEDAGLPSDLTRFSDFEDACKELTSSSQNRWALGSNPLAFIRQMQGIPFNWKESGGKFTSAVQDERQEDALEAARSLIAKGYANPDVAAAAPAQMSQWMLKGSAAFMFSTYATWSALYAQRTDKKATFGVYQVPGFSGGTGTGWGGVANNNIVGFPKASEARIETLLKTADYFASPFGSEEYRFLYYGIEGADFTLDGGDPVPASADVSHLWLGTRYLGSPPVALYYSPPQSDLVEEVWNHTETYLKTAVFDPSMSLYSETLSRSGGSIGAALVSVENDIVFGRRPVSAWKDAVKTFMSSGGSKIADELAKAAEANR